MVIYDGGRLLPERGANVSQCGAFQWLITIGTIDCLARVSASLS